MLRQSSSRIPRSKGFKVKHVLQICLLLAICLWLIYQVKHSHDKKKEFDVEDANISETTHSGSDLTLKIGRKGLNPQVVQIIVKNEKPEEEEEGETDVEGENKHEEEQKDETENEEKEDEGRSAGDEEKTDTEVYREEDNTDEEIERENEGDEKYEEKEDQTENESSAEDQIENTHEAREEHYKGDDASSAVTHGIEIENVDFQNSNGNAESDDVLKGFQTNIVDKYSIERKVIESHSKLKMGEDEVGGNETSLNSTANERKASGSTSVTGQDDSLQNVTNTTDSRNQTEADNSSTEAATETSNASNLNQTQTVTVQGTVTGEGSGLKMVVHEQSSNPNGTSVDHQSDSNPPVPTKAENVVEPAKPKNIVTSHVKTGGDSSGSSKTVEITQMEESNTERNQTGKILDSTAKAGNGSWSLTALEDANASQNEKLETRNGTNEPDRGLGISSTGENVQAVHRDPIDSADSSIYQEEQDAHTDLDALPEIRNEVSDSEDAAAE